MLYQRGRLSFSGRSWAAHLSLISHLGVLLALGGPQTAAGVPYLPCYWTQALLQLSKLAERRAGRGPRGCVSGSALRTQGTGGAWCWESWMHHVERLEQLRES